MAKIKLTRLLLAMPALLVCTGMLQAVTSPLGVSASTAALTWTKGVAGAAGTASTGVQITITDSAASAASPQLFTVNSATLPTLGWLTVSPQVGNAPTAAGTKITFTANAAGDTLAPGTYTASVGLSAAGYDDKVIVVTLTVKNAVPNLTVTGTGSTGFTLNSVTSASAPQLTLSGTWSYGAAVPSIALWPLSSSSDPISYAATVTNPATLSASATISSATGIAYDVAAKPLTVTLSPIAFLQASTGTTLATLITLTPSAGTVIKVQINILVSPQRPTVTGISPGTVAVSASSVPTQLVLTGTNFVSGSSQTVVGIGASSPGTSLATSAVTVVSSTSILIALPNAVNLASAGTLHFWATNGAQTSTGSATLTVTTNPIIYAITNAASFNQATAGTVAPFEMISIFGDNFGPAAADAAITGNPTSSSGDTNAATPDLRYPTQLNYTSGVGGAVTVTLASTDGGFAALPAYILLLTKKQINVIVPAGIVKTWASSVGTLVADLTLTVTNTPTSLSALTSSAFTLTPAIADPGILTIAASGVGQAAVYNSDGSLNSSSNQASKLTTVSMYLTGLGTPTNGLGTTTTLTNSSVYPATCVSMDSYLASMTALDSAAWAATSLIDGAVIESSALSAFDSTPALAKPPCFPLSATPSTVGGTVSVTVGGQSATVVYAGFVADSVAGLYQVNFTVPNITANLAAPVIVSIGDGTTSWSSPAGVTMATK